MEEVIDPPKLSVQDFATKIKAKYPQYKDIPNDELANKVIAKHPEYESQVDLQKKSPDQTTSVPSSSGGGTSPTSTSQLSGIERAQQSIERRRLALEQGIKSTVEQDPIYQNPVNQETLKGNLGGISGVVKDVGTSWLQSLSEQAKSTADTYKQVSVESARRPTDPKDVLEKFANVTTGTLKLGVDAMLTVGLASPVGVAFAAGMDYIKKMGVSDETINKAMHPVRTVLEGGYFAPVGLAVPKEQIEAAPDYAKNTLDILDVSAFAALLGMKESTREAFKRGNPTEEQKTEINKAFEDVTPNAAKAAATHLNNPELASKEKEILDTHDDLQKVSDEAKPAIGNKLNQLETEKQGIEQQQVQSQVQQAHEQTVNDIKDNLEQQAQREDISEPSKKAIKTMADNLKIGDTVEMGVNPKEENKVMIPKQEFNIEFESPVTKEQMSVRIVPDKGDFVSGYNMYQGNKKVGRIGANELRFKLQQGEYKITQPAGEEIVPRGTSDVTPTDVFHTMDMGDLTGKEENAKTKKQFTDAFKAGDEKVGNTGESSDDFKQRTIHEFQKILQSEPNAVIVTHSSDLKLFKTWDAMGRPDVSRIIKDGDLSDEFNKKYLKQETQNGDVETFKGDKGNVYVVRHGETEDNLHSNFRTPETQLTDKGRQEAKDAGELLKAYTGGEKPKVISSDFPRTMETSKIIGEQFEPSGTTGISIKAREQRATATGAEPTESGVGWTGAEALARGNELLAKGTDPIEMINDDKIPLHDKVAIAQAQANKLGKETNAAGDKYGINSNEYKNAKAKENEYLKQVKPLSTLSHKAFAAHQGEVEIDTGSWTGLVRAAEADGTKLSPKQVREAKELSDKVKTLTEQVENLKKKLTDAVNAAVEETPKNIKQRAKEIADIIRKGKTSRPSVFSAASPASLVWDGALEVAAKTVEAGGTIAQAIADGINHIKASEWYKNFDKKSEAEKAFRDHFNEFTNDDLFTKFVDKKDSKFVTQEVKDIWDYAKKNYLDKGRTYEDMLSGVSKDLSLTTGQIRNALAQPKNARVITNEMYRTQYRRNQAVNTAKQWVRQMQTPRIVRMAKAIPAFFFEKAIFGHGTVGMITHAGLNMFNPATWSSYWKNFGRQFKFLVKPEAYEKAKEDLQDSDNYVIARRAGLANDPNSVYDDYGGWKKYFGKLGMAGDRGFFALKTFRQELFNHYYDKLSDSEKADPQIAKEIASIVNHATGTHKIPVPETVGTAIFAPRLEASRWERMIVEPVKAVTTFTNWKDATPAEKVQAEFVAKRAGAIATTYFAGLAINQGALSVTGSDKKINFFDPLKSDWLKFKWGDKSFDTTGGMVSSMHLLAKLLKLPFTTQQERHGESVFEKATETTGQYVRGKFSPFASTSTEVYTSHDYSGNTMPWSDEKPLHKYNHKMTWKEYLWSQAPIPASEGARDVYMEMENKGLSQPRIESYFTGVWVGLVSGGTGTRVGVEPKEPIPYRQSRPDASRQERRGR